MPIRRGEDVLDCAGGRPHRTASQPSPKPSVKPPLSCHCVNLGERGKIHLKSVHSALFHPAFSPTRPHNICPQRPDALGLNSGCSSSQIDSSASAARCQSASVPRRSVGAAEGRSGWKKLIALINAEAALTENK